MFTPTLTLTMDNAKQALQAGLAAIAGGQTEIDLAGLTQVDSGGVAVLLAWQRAAMERKQALVFHNPPQNLRSIARLYGVGDFLYPEQAA
ncbi:MAG TPA: STAS domain-containing protein [Burkholderiaceae bacterium]|jgi:phospholipid transport system transporter-binding protein